jgi:pilus assembly protein CpaB
MQERERKTPDKRPLWVAIALGALAAVLVVVYLGGSSDDPEALLAEATGPVVVAREPIPAGQRITATMLELKEVPVSAVSEGTFSATAQVVGQRSRYPIERGEQVTEQRLIAASRTGAISFHIPPGMRAMTIPVSATRSPATLLVPGDFIDVIVTGEASSLLPPAPGRAATASVALTLLQNVQVLSVERNFVDSGIVYDDSVRGQAPAERQGVSFVTVSVTPEQAQVVALALEEASSLTFVLRAFGDDGILPLQPRVEPVFQP